MKKILLLMFILFSYVSFSFEWAKPIDVNLNMYQVDTNLVRSQQLKKENTDILKKNDIKTIINLRYFNQSEDKQNFDKNEFNLINFPLITWSISNEEVAKILYTIEKESKKGKVLIHCYHGSDRTGLISAMYRIIYQNWSIEDAKNELKNGPYGYHSIWINILKMINEDNIEEIKYEINLLRRIS